MADKTYTRYQQAQVVADAGFMAMVEASVMVVAYQVLQDTENPDYEQRAGLSRTLLYVMTPQSTVDSIVKRFAWWVVNDPTVIAEYGAGGGDVQQISDQAIDAAVLAFWSDASAVGMEGSG
mgnify:CR=1 FL=1